MSKKNKIFLACDEAQHVCNKTQYKNSTFWEKIKLNIHLLYCAACRKYSSNNSKLTKIVKQSNVDCLDDDCKEAMRKELEKAIKENAL
ncbi:hypothetical protein GCM10022291_29600 [Postechiella marina]|uniref:Glycine dehydrogenase n=1 Tax=Postechiella marina TaxID=943941 RepID=A0ABP8CF80_9FLAO